jgi:hypothetical protein
MVPVYIGSTKSYSGKSLVSLGLALKLKEDGFKVGYMKPYGRVPVVLDGVLTDGDAAFIKKTLGLPDPIDKLCPVVFSQDLLAAALRDRGKSRFKAVMQAYKSVSKGKDVMLIGGARDMHDGTILGISGLKLVSEMDAKVIIVDPFDGDTCLDCVLALKEILGERLIGVVLNRVPQEGMDYLRSLVSPFLERHGIALLGLLPSDKLLDSITIRQLSDALGGNVLCCEDRMEELVENFSIGAMDVDSALKYFRRTPNKAVITGGHRSDIQLAALETSTKCLVLTGDLLPNSLIISKARLSGVPLISVKHDTLATVELLEGMLGKARIREESKVVRARQLMDAYFDYVQLYRMAGIQPTR